MGSTHRASIRLRCVSLVVAVVWNHGALYAQAQWPLDPTNVEHALWHGYGTYTDLGGPHMHEGIDIFVEEIPPPGGPNVRAIESGTVVEIHPSPDPNNDWITVLRANQLEAWRYTHIDVDPQWTVNDSVAQGALLGTIHDHTALMDHLHVERIEFAGTDPDGTNVDDPIDGDPLDYLVPNTDAEDPGFQGFFFHYREAAGEGVPGATYFTDFVGPGRLLMGNVDIIIQAEDEFPNAGYPIGVKRIDMAVTPSFAGGGTIPTYIFEDFSGHFLAGVDGVNLHFYDAPYLDAIFEDDNTVDSQGHSAGAGGLSLGNGDYYYIVTNTDGDNDIEPPDADHYWNTNVVSGSAWHATDNQVQDAATNANAEFPDGRYRVTVTVFGQGLTQGAHASTSRFDFVYVNNFSQSITTNKSDYAPGETVAASGANYLPNTPYTIYVIEHTEWLDGASIPSHGTVRTSTNVVSEPDGTIGWTLLWSAYTPNGSPDAGYDIIVDYDGDHVYHEPRNGVTIDALAFIESPERCLSIGLAAAWVPGGCPTGACCFADGSCAKIEYAQCNLQGGVYHGDHTNCASVDCLGACCLPDGSCTQLTEINCQAQGGEYRGGGSDCASVACSGACCLPDGSCAELSQADCLGNNGWYHGDGTLCADVNCPGMCCLPDGSCSDLFEAQCLAVNGTFQGPGTACSGPTCDPVPCADCANSQCLDCPTEAMVMLADVSTGTCSGWGAADCSCSLSYSEPMSRSNCYWSYTDVFTPCSERTIECPSFTFQCVSITIDTICDNGEGFWEASVFIGKDSPPFEILMFYRKPCVGPDDCGLGTYYPYQVQGCGVGPACEVVSGGTLTLQ